MPDQSIQVLVEIISRGGPAAEQVIKQVTQAAKEGSAAAKKILEDVGRIPPVIAAASASAGAGGHAEGGGMGSAMRRHFGAMAGQLLGMPGLGMMAAVGGMAAGIGVATLALEKMISKLNEWQESIGQTVRASMDFDLIATRIATLGSLTREVSEHNKDLALSYSQIERNVRTVAAEMAHLTEIQTIQLQFQQRLDDARLAQDKARIDLATRFNPIARIQQTEAAEEAHFERQMQRERALMELRLKAHQREAQRAADEQERYTTEADALKATLPDLQKKALMDKGREQTIAAENERKRAEMSKELELINEMALGKDSGMKWAFYRAGAPSHLNPSTDASDALLTNPSNRRKAQARKEELESALNGLNESNASAGQVTATSEGKARRQAAAAQFAEEKAKGLAEEQSKAAFDAEQDAEIIKAQEETRQQEIEARKGAMQQKATQGVMDASSAQPIGPLTSDASAVLKSIDEKMSQLITQWS